MQRNFQPLPAHYSQYELCNLIDEITQPFAQHAISQPFEFVHLLNFRPKKSGIKSLLRNHATFCANTQPFAQTRNHLHNHATVCVNTQSCNM
jgi:hypothetical protein